MVDLPLRNGIRLCSHRNPQGQAEQWVASLSENPVGTWIVLGIGAGFHLRALRERFPRDQFLFLDFDSEIELNAPVGAGLQTSILRSNFESGEVFSQWILPRLNKGFKVVSFKACWTGLEDSFRRLESLLLGRQGECNPLISTDAGLKKAFFSVPPSLEINIKSLTETDLSQPSLRWRRLRALRELVS